jgi:carbonic anhydrase/acetyltransferase-like protein (isoleucine patch superfamily)
MPLLALGDRKPRVPPPGRFWVAPTATIIGNVVLEEDASIWFGVVLRGDNEAIRIGAGSNVQDLTVIHTDPGFPCTIGANSTIGHRAILHGCTIGEGALIGMGAIVLNGAVIGKDCLIGAGALIAEGKTIPERSLVLGAPGRVVRELDDAAIAKMQLAAPHYVANWKRFVAELR